MFATEITVPFIPLYCKQVLSFSEVEIGAMYTLAFLTSTAAYMVGGVLADKLGHAKAMFLSLALNTPIFLILPLAWSEFSFTAFWVVSSFVFSMHEAPETGFVVSVAPPELRATATAAATLQGISTSFGPLVGGPIWSIVNTQAQFIATATIAFIAIILFGAPLLGTQEKSSCNQDR